MIARRSPSTPLGVAAALVFALAAPAAAQAPPAYVGTPACAACHAKEHAAWQGTPHAKAMAEANERTVLGNFANATFTHKGVTTRFFRRDGRYFVRTDGPDGKPGEFEVRHTFGVYPLQQYLVELPRGRLQALGIAWDARAKASGGQRWFHLYPDRKLAAGSPLHWTGLDQTWNYQCADCHSTNLRKNYDAASRTYKTTYSEISVGCEACHGPGSRHVDWAKRTPAERAATADKGLAVRLDERRGVTWPIGASGTATRSAPRASSREIEVCARCHARRGQFRDDWHAGAPLADAFRVATIEPGLYYADGQVRDEVYEHGSFLQSRMHASGVTCADCHEPHGQKLRAPGNAVCGQCHASAQFDTAAHHHHKPGTAAAACTSCHMPTTTYMVIDPRHDHSIRVPRPDRTLAIGTPNACGQCHAKEGARWAADAIRRWSPAAKPGFQSFAEPFASGERGAPGAQAALRGVVDDVRQPALVRASAIQRLAPRARRDDAAAIVRALGDADATVRAAAARTLRGTDPAFRARALAPLLADPLRDVRMEAVRGLLGAPERGLSEGDRVRLEAGLLELEGALMYSADRPESHAQLATLRLARGRPDAAMTALREALALDPTYAPASVNLADVLRGMGREADAQAVLAQAIKADPAAASPHHALGLSYAREKRMPEAIAALGTAAKLAPQDARYAYVHGVALHDAGRRDEALKVLRAALDRHPWDRELLFATATYERERGELARASQRAVRLAELDPDDREVRRFAEELAAAAKAKR